jgi:hypothetical protein
MYGAGDEYIGKGVIVPHGYYKIVINNNTKQIAGWRFPHTKPYVNLGNDLTKFRVPVAQIMQEAGVTYAFPQGAKEVQPGQESVGPNLCTSALVTYLLRCCGGSKLAGCPVSCNEGSEMIALSVVVRALISQGKPTNFVTPSLSQR